MLGLRLERANKIAEKHVKNWERNIPELYRPSDEDRIVIRGIARKTRCKCSCPVCRNLRQDEGPTRKEIKFMHG
jgi:hypothetical protein